MTTLREKLKAVTDMQSPINGPGIERLNELLTAIVDEIETAKQPPWGASLHPGT